MYFRDLNQYRFFNSHISSPLAKIVISKIPKLKVLFNNVIYLDIDDSREIKYFGPKSISERVDSDSWNVYSFCHELAHAMQMIYLNKPHKLALHNFGFKQTTTFARKRSMVDNELMAFAFQVLLLEKINPSEINFHHWSNLFYRFSGYEENSTDWSYEISNRAEKYRPSFNEILDKTIQELLKIENQFRCNW